MSTLATLSVNKNKKRHAPQIIKRNRKPTGKTEDSQADTADNSTAGSSNTNLPTNTASSAPSSIGSPVSSSIQTPNNPASSIIKPTISSSIRTSNTTASSIRAPSISASSIRAPSNSASSIRAPSNSASSIRAPSNSASSIRAPSNSASSIRAPSNSASSINAPSNSASSISTPRRNAPAVSPTVISAPRGEGITVGSRSTLSKPVESKTKKKRVPMVISATSPVLSNASLSNTTASAISTNRRMARRSTITPVFDIELDRLEVRIKNKHIRGRLESGDRPKQSKIPKKLSTQKKHEERERSKQLEKEKKKKEREEERLMLKEQERQRKEEERKRKEEAKAYKLLENMRTMDDIHYDPVKEVDLEKSMFEFINDIDGIVSKTYKEAVMQQEAEKIKQQNMKKLNLEEQAELKRKEEEEAERKRKIELQKQEERRKQNANVLQETSNSLQVRLVNGQIVLDADSLTVDRGHSSINYEDGSMEVVEESSMTKKVNSHSYGKRKASSRWTAEETENFYEALSQFGTDFEMISKVMPGRLRSQIRSKFTREERVNPGKVTDYMIRKRKPVDIKEFEKITGMELDEVPEDFMDM